MGRTSGGQSFVSVARSVEEMPLPRSMVEKTTANSAIRPVCVSEVAAGWNSNPHGSVLLISNSAGGRDGYVTHCTIIKRGYGGVVHNAQHERYTHDVGRRDDHSDDGDWRHGGRPRSIDRLPDGYDRPRNDNRRNDGRRNVCTGYLDRRNDGRWNHCAGNHSRGHDNGEFHDGGDASRGNNCRRNNCRRNDCRRNSCRRNDGRDDDVSSVIGAIPCQSSCRQRHRLGDSKYADPVQRFDALGQRPAGHARR